MEAAVVMVALLLVGGGVILFTSRRSARDGARADQAEAHIDAQDDISRARRDRDLRDRVRDATFGKR